MTKTVETMASEILALPAAERSRLLDRVVASLDADAERDTAWDAMAARRDAEIDEGTASLQSLDDVLARRRAEPK
jgi:hypothetical protein